VSLGHFRTCSEISSVSCQSESGDSGEADRLLKKIFELSEILEARETKMVELSRSNLELQEQNVDLARYAPYFILLRNGEMHNSCWLLYLD
jgi:hypothetical protein